MILGASYAHLRRPRERFVAHAIEAGSFVGTVTDERGARRLIVHPEDVGQWTLQWKTTGGEKVTRNDGISGSK